MNKSQDFQEPNQHTPDVQSYECCNKCQLRSSIGKPGNHHQVIQEEKTHRRLVLAEEVAKTGAQSVRGRWYASIIRHREKHEQILAQNTCNN